MSDQALNLATSAAILWRHKVAAAVLILAGLVGNTAYALAHPDMYTSTATVMLSSTVVNFPGQAVVATSVPVLSGALRTGHLPLSLKTLQSRIQAAPGSVPTIAVTGEGSTAQEAERVANAVARSYVAYVTSPTNPAGQQAAQLRQRAANAVAKPRTTRVYQAAGGGLLAGVLVALIAVLAIGRADRRLRTRNDIADLAGAPVLASVRVRGPKDVAGWVKLLERSETEATQAWQMRHALLELGVLLGSGPDAGFSATVLSLSGDRDAIAVGPRLAAFAATQGVSTALVIGRLPETRAAAALRAACAASAGRVPDNLLLLPADDGQGAHAQAITIAVQVVDSKAPMVADLPRDRAAVLVVSAAVVTSEQLAQVMASATVVGVRIVGVLVVNPDPRDQTTGRLPQLARSEQQAMPNRITSVVTGRRR